MAPAMWRANAVEVCVSPVRQKALRDPLGVTDEVATADAVFGPGYWLPRCDGFSLFVAGERARVSSALVTAQVRAELCVWLHQRLFHIDVELDSVRIDPVARLVKIECFH
jgi:hypothetical protein